MRVGELLGHWRYQMKLNIRDASKIIGISPSSLSRIERGYMPDGPVLLAMVNWLFKPEEKKSEPEAGGSTNSGN